MMMMMMMTMLIIIMVMLTILIRAMHIRTPLLLSLLHNAGEQTIRQLLSLGEDPGARDMVNDHDHNNDYDDDIMIMIMI